MVRTFLPALLLVAVSWLYLRLRLRAPWRPAAPLFLDAALMAWCWAFPLVLTARPLLSACVVAGGAVGLALADRVKRATVAEPLVFADRAELAELFRHPQLYLPFAGTTKVLSAASLLLLIFGALAAKEPKLPLPWTWRWILIAACAALYCGSSIVPFRRRLSALFAGWAEVNDPAATMRRLGTLGSFFVQATLAAEERKERQHCHLPCARLQPGPARPLVMVQAESFFDVRRLDFGLGEDRVPHFSALMDECVLHGRLAVPCWGANTVRTEFAVLTGIEPASLGLDRFNPYERFARAPVDSIAWKLRASGYTTICVHPFDTRFYDRRRVLPQLGFDRFVGPEAFSRPAPGAYVSDHEVAAEVSRLLAQNGKLVFIFVITMQTHGPWLAPKIDRRPRRMTPGGGVLQGYLTAVQNADAALPEFRQEVQAADGILAIYGDHQPSLPRLAALGIDTTETDYLIWDSRRGIPRRRDLRAAQLSEALQAIAMRPRLRLLQEAG